MCKEIISKIRNNKRFEKIEKDAYNYEDTIDIKTIINLITKALEN